MFTLNRGKLFLLLISFYVFLTSSIYAENNNKFPINVDFTELQEFDGIRDNSLLEKTLIRPRFLVKYKNKKHWNHNRRGFNIKALYFCESAKKCDSINLSGSNSERMRGQKIFPYFVGSPKKYHSIWVEYRVHKNKRKFKKLNLRAPVDFSNPYAYEIFFDAKKRGGKHLKYLASGGVATSDATVVLYRPKKVFAT